MSHLSNDPIVIRTMQRNISVLYLTRGLLTGFMLASPLVYVWWESHEVSLTSIATLVSLFSIALVVLELPSGYVADNFGRRFSLMTGAVCSLVGAVLYGAFPTFWSFVAAELFFALGISLISGSDQALLYDSLAVLGKEKEFARVWGNCRVLDLLIGAVLSAIGGYLAKIDMHVPFFAAAFLLLGAFGLLLCLKEPSIATASKSDIYPIHALREALTYCFIKSRATTWLLVFSAVAFTFSGAFDTYSKLYLKKIDVPVEYFGWIVAGSTLIAAIAAKLCFYIDRRIRFSGTIALIAGLLSVGLIGIGLAPGYLGLAFFLLPYFQRGYNGVSLARYINDSVPSEIRATTASILNMIGRLVTAITVPVLAIVIEQSNVFVAFAGFGVTAAVVLGLLFLARPQRIVVSA